MDKLLLAILVMLGVVIISNPISNLIANMYGPHFLFFYGFVISVTLIICRLGIDEDETAQHPTPVIPKKLDPYEIAYLRGAEVELIKVVITNLIQKGLLELTGNTMESTLKAKMDLKQITSQLSVIDREMLKKFESPQANINIITLSQLSSFSKYYRVYEQKLIQKQLLLSKEMKAYIFLLTGLAILIIVGLGGYKLIVALSKGHTNVNFLFYIGLIAIFFLQDWCKKARITHMGKKYLKRLQQTFNKFQDTEFLNEAFLNSEISDSSYSLAVGIFGLGILSGTNTEFVQIFNQTLNQKDGGGGCGGGGCGGGCGGCGGCGG